MNIYTQAEVSRSIDEFNSNEETLERRPLTDTEVLIVNQLNILRDLAQISLEVQCGLAKIES